MISYQAGEGLKAGILEREKPGTKREPRKIKIPLSGSNAEKNIRANACTENQFSDK
jgi:hypothetical protein